METVVADVEAWLRAEATDSVRSIRRQEAGAEGTSLQVDLHPAAQDMGLWFDPTGRVEVVAPTAEAGPGYHTFVAQLLKRLAADVSIEWLDPANEAEGDPTGYFTTGDRAQVDRVHLGWLHAVLKRAADARARRTGTVQLVPFGGHRFESDAAVATPLGPRDDSWLLAALESPRVAADVWPWQADAMDARYLLTRALCLMWTEVRWRAPFTDEERTVLDEVLRLLRKAFPTEPGLPYPWREWRDLLQFAGAADDPMSERVVKEAARPSERPLIGYRREPVTVIHAGWELTVPGSFAERRTNEEWWGAEAGRAITIAAIETGEGNEPMPPETFLDRVAGHLGRDALVHRAGPVVGRARIEVDSRTGVEVAVLDGYAAVLGSGAAMRIEIDDPGDWEWALEMWRSLGPARGSR